MIAGLRANMALCLVALVILAVSSPLASGAALTGAWEPCAKSDPDIGGCMKNSIQKFLPFLSKGIPKVSIKPLDPLELDSLDLSSPNLKMMFKKSVLSNLFSTSTIVKVEPDVDGYSLRVVLEAPEVISEGQYELDGKLLVMAVKGEGPFKLVYKNVLLDTKFIGKPVTRDGKTYMELEDVQVEFTPQGLRVQADNLFNGNKELGDAFNKFANENWKEIFEDVKKELWQKLGLLFKSNLKPLFANVPYDEIYNL